MCVAPGVNQLGIDADVVARSPHAPFQDIAHGRLAADLLGADALALIGNAVLCEITSMSAIRDKSVVRSSVIPSAKYCCSGSLLRLTNGSTTIDSRDAAGGREFGEVRRTPDRGGSAMTSG
jgi:hypothetical protein